MTVPQPETLKPIATAPRDPGLFLPVLWLGHRVGVYWWHHFSMQEGVWWSPQHGAITPTHWFKG